MKPALALLAVLLLTTPLLADAADDVRATETAFAKAFADRDKAKFFAFVADDAKFLGRKQIQTGKKEVVAAWSGFLDSKDAPFSWRPERVVANDAGNLGFSTGPIFDPAGVQVGTFTSTWQKQKDESWKIIFDGGSQCGER